jgi:multiple sugar transport system ATP-binding protein
VASVTFRGVEKRFGDVEVVRGVDLELADGELLVLLGASGCGKSTLLRMLAGLEAPTGGDILIGERRVNDVKPKERDVAMVFQSYALYPHMTVRQNMAFGLKVRGEDPAKIEVAVQEAAEMLGIEGLLDRKPKEMSGGQRQRVAMGRAIVRRPQVFLFDEPLSNLDAALRARMRVELKRLHQRLGVTTVYVTHDQVDAMTLADRVALMHQGRIQQIGTPDELYDWPANRYTAGFLGSPPMNTGLGGAEGGRIKAPGIDLGGAEELLGGSSLPARVVFGVRPHDLFLDAEGAEGGTVRGRVEVLEPLGWETHLHFAVDGATWTARLDSAQARRVRPGDEVVLRVRTEDVRLFDVETGAALYRRPSGGA